MDDLNIAEAARQTGKDRKTIYRLMKSGKLSFKVTADGHRVIDPAELWRVFPKSAPCHNGGTVPQDATESTEVSSNSGALSETSSVAILQAQLDAALAREKVALEREQAAMERERQAVEREKWLRDRLAESEKERLELAHRLLPPGQDNANEAETQANPQGQEIPNQTEDVPRKSWWQRLFG